MASRPNLLHVLGCSGRNHFAIKTRNKRRPPPARKIHHVDGVALVHEIIGPARPPVGSLQQRYVGLSASCLHEYDRIWMLYLLGPPHLDIHGAAHPLFARFPYPLATYVEMALASNFFCRKGWDRCQRDRYLGIVSPHAEAVGNNG